MNTIDRTTELAYGRNMSLLHLAQISGVNYCTFTAARRRNSQLKIETIERVCDALGIQLKDFFDDDFQFNPEDCKKEVAAK